MKTALFAVAVASVAAAASLQFGEVPAAFDDTHDVGVVRIIAPTGTIDSNINVTPACSVVNFGNLSESYWVRMRIGNTYNESVRVAGHMPHDRLYATFPTWSWHPRGSYGVSCSTMLASDQRPDNDKTTGTVSVRVRDVAAVLLNTPTPGGVYPVGRVIVPMATWRNYGSVTAVFDAWMCIANGSGARVYACSIRVPYLTPGGSIFVTALPACTLVTTGFWTAKCSTAYSGDLTPVNDTLIRTFLVTDRLPDVSVVAVIAPADTVDSGAAVMPRAVVANLSPGEATFPVWMRIGDTYGEWEDLTLAGATVDTVEFASWTAQPPGPQPVLCFTALAADANPHNDSVLTTVFVLPQTGVAKEHAGPLARDRLTVSPTPFRSRTTISVNLTPRPLDSPAPLARIYNSAGCLVRVLHSGGEGSGHHTVVWDGSDGSGGRVAPGIYYCRLEAGDFQAIKKLVKLD